MNRINITLSVVAIIISVVGTVLIQSYESTYKQKKNELPKETMELQLQQGVNVPGRYNLNYRTYTLDGCEYIVVGGTGYGIQWGSQKGNCKNPIHYTK